MTGFFDAIIGYFSALGFAIRHRLFGYMIIPGIISLLIGLVFLGSAYYFSDDLGLWMTQWLPFDFGKNYFEWIFTGLSGLIILFTGLLLYKSLLLIFIGPFMGPLSEKVERLESNHPQYSSFSVQQIAYEMIRGMRLATRNGIIEITLTLLLLLIGLIPLFTLFTTIAIIILQAYYLGFANFDYYLERRANLKQSISFAKNHKLVLIGNGLAMLALIFFVPVLGLMVAPTLGTIAAARQMRTLYNH